jgi:hypothetical protein
MLWGNEEDRKRKSGAADKATEAQLGASERAKGTLGESKTQSETALRQGLTDYTGRMERGLADYTTGATQGLKAYQEEMRPWQTRGNTALDQYMATINKGVGVGTDPVFTQGEQLLKQRLAASGASQSPSAMAQGYTPLISELYGRNQAQQAQTLSALMPLINYGYTASENIGQAGYNTNQAIGQMGFNTQQAIGTAGRDTQNSLANLYQQYGANLANLETGQGEIKASNELYKGSQGSIFGDLANLGGMFLSYQMGGPMAAAAKATQQVATQAGQPSNQYAGSGTAPNMMLSNYYQGSGVAPSVMSQPAQAPPMQYPTPQWQSPLAPYTPGVNYSQALQPTYPVYGAWDGVPYPDQQWKKPLTQYREAPLYSTTSTGRRAY